jgi:ABC-type multidrug transport system fused ATPase/permease subunit
MIAVVGRSAGKTTSSKLPPSTTSRQAPHHGVDIRHVTLASSAQIGIVTQGPTSTTPSPTTSLTDRGSVARAIEAAARAAHAQFVIRDARRLHTTIGSGTASPRRPAAARRRWRGAADRAILVLDEATSA